MRRLVVGIVLLSSVAHAGRVEFLSSTAGSGADPSPAVVHGKLAGSVARLSVRYLLTVEAGFSNEIATLALPRQGIVTGATVGADGGAHRLDLLPAKDAGDRFAALAGEEEDAAKVGAQAWGALLSLPEGGSLQIGIAAPHAGFVTLEVEVQAPTCFYRDARYVLVPDDWARTMDFDLRKRVVKHTDDLATACAANGDDGMVWLGFPSQELVHRPSGDRIGATAGRLVLANDHVARVELGLASILSDVPRDLATAIIVDSSRSMGADQLEAQRELVMSYLAKVPDTRVQVVAYARTAKALLPSWMTAGQAASRVDRELHALAQRNGSNFDAGLIEAASWLARVQGTRRILLVTDEQFAERLSTMPPATLRRLLPEGTLVHVVAIDHSGALARDETAVLAPLAAATDGMAVRVGPAEEGATLDATMLARPISIDQLQIKAPGWTLIKPDDNRGSCSDADQLGEGRSCTWWGQGDAVSGPIAVEGLLWGKRVARVLRPDLAQARDLARELSTLGSLEQPAQARADAMARAVNGTWSLFATWGGKRGYEALYGGLISSGCGCGGGTSSTSSVDTGIGTMSGVQAFSLKDQLQTSVAACHVEQLEIATEIEMTMLEIVDVRVTVTGPRTANELRKAQTCVENAIWDATPMIPHPQSHHTYEVAFRPAAH